MCYFIAIPIGVILPITEAGINISWLSTVGNIFLGVGLASIVLLFLIRIA
jgi:hypothetical protein